MSFAELAASAYPWLKAFHVIAVIAWMAGIFYLPRLFVYHAGSSIGSEKSETFKLMEQRLLSAIMTPAMVATWVLLLVIVSPTFCRSPTGKAVVGGSALAVGQASLYVSPTAQKQTGAGVP